jgi:hypothetical protein
MPHPYLWPAIAGAAIGLALIVWASLRLYKSWGRLAPRRRWLAFAAIALFEAQYWANIYAWFVEPNMLVVRRVEIASEDWRGAPLTIAAVADTHVGGPHVNAARVGRIVQRVNRLRPDLVVLLGDYVGGHEPRAERSAQDQNEVLNGIATFAAFNARLGAIGVLGNHDVWYGREDITRAMEEAGVATLWNRNVEIAREGGDFIVAGLADHATGPPRFAYALDGAERRDTIVISHSPDPFATMPDGPALMIAAHSHCGQVTLPFFGRLVLPIRNRAYACGLVRERGQVLYVTGGIGTSIVPVRFLNPPEVVLITIRSAPAVERA